MTQFIRLLSHADIEQHLLAACGAVRRDEAHAQHFEKNPELFSVIPGKPLAYWVSEEILDCFARLKNLDESGHDARIGLQTGDDFRFIRLWWEPDRNSEDWAPHAKGGRFSKYYEDLHLLVKWSDSGAEVKNFVDLETKKIRSRPQNVDYYYRPGLTWTKSTTLPPSFRIMPADAISGVSGLGMFVADDSVNALYELLAIVNSSPFAYLLTLSLGLAAEGRKHYEAGIVQKNPMPNLTADQSSELRKMAERIWQLKYQLDSLEEQSHAFLMPLAFQRSRLSCSNCLSEIEELKRRIDDVVFAAYDFSEEDRAAAAALSNVSEDISDSVEIARGAAGLPSDPTGADLSWALGVAFGRFDWRLATGERDVPDGAAPLDPLLPQSRGMLPADAEPFKRHYGVLVDDPGHEYDLAHLVESVLEQVEISVPDNLRRWLQKNFFTEHLSRYSMSRRKAPIYWPLSTMSGSYTLWIYYPDLDDQTLYTVVNDFLGPKLKSIDEVLNALRSASGRTVTEERELEKQQDLQHELIELRDTILEIAPNYEPNHDDGVQITAAPLWPLFRHKPWQKALKDTWEKLEAGEYDWAHLAYSYWPDRVREKCKTDKSLAIAHGLENLYEEPAA